MICDNNNTISYVNKSPSCTVYIVRPGPTPDNYVESHSENSKTGRWSNLDLTALSEEGIKEAKKAAEVFKDIDFHVAYCSKAKRTFDTAKIILDSKDVEIIPDDLFYEMRIGPLAGKTSEQIIELFCQETGYPDPSTKEKLPNLWAKRKGGPLKHGNDCLLDKWHPEIDVFDEFAHQFLERVQKIVNQNLGKNVLIVPHGTPMKAWIAQAWNVPVDTVQCAKGSYYVAEIAESGNVILLDHPRSGISLESLDPH